MKRKTVGMALEDTSTALGRMVAAQRERATWTREQRAAFYAAARPKGGDNA